MKEKPLESWPRKRNLKGKLETKKEFKIPKGNAYFKSKEIKILKMLLLLKSSKFKWF